MDSSGNAAQRGKLGLLLYNGGTVCDDYFNRNAADAICKLMNYTHSERLTSDDGFDIQVSASLLLVVVCKLFLLQSD